MTLVVGFPPGKDDWSSIELGATLARSAGTDLLVVTVVPSVWPTPVAGHTDREFEDWAEQQGAAAVAEANAILAEHCPDVAAVARWTPGRSVASALLEQAEEVAASMIVVGSGSTGSYGRVHPGAIGDWLLHSSHIPVAVATHGFAASEHGRVSRVSCAFRGDERSMRTAERTAAICADDRRVAAAGHLRRARPHRPHLRDRRRRRGHGAGPMGQPGDGGPGGGPQAAEGVGSARRPWSTHVVASGRSWGAAIDRLDWDRDEVLVVGSSSAGVIERIFLGSNASKLVRHAPVPVVVVP